MLNLVRQFVALAGPGNLFCIFVIGLLLYNAVKQTILRIKKVNQKYSTNHRTW